HGSKVDCMHKREMSNALLSWRLGSRFDLTLRGASAARGGSDLKSEGTVGAAAIKHIFLFFAARLQRDADFFASTAAEGGEGARLAKRSCQ
ncbi:hypothetical protein, partial [Mesorhizobium sp. M7A.F.Ca.CA.004.04.2.1]|uniref:hypothetical protein n=1 Tax=Mesorhizobium sp. M7A.F.Ca.CA.004.04.2.1 TaxID=2496677 RepID=UPI0019D473A1